MEPNNRNNNNSEEKKQECIKLAILGLILVAVSSVVGSLVKFVGQVVIVISLMYALYLYESKKK